MLHPYNVARHLASMSQREALNGTNTEPSFTVPSLVGASFAIVLVVLLVALAIYVWAIWALYHYWTSLNPIAKVLGIVFLFPNPVGPFGTLAVVYLCLNIESCHSSTQLHEVEMVSGQNQTDKDK